MMLYLFVFGPAVVTYLCLVALPQGRTALIGVGIAGFLFALTLLATDWHDEAYLGPLLALVGGAIMFACLVQLARALLNLDRKRWSYPVAALLVLVGVMLPLASLFKASL
ncbi:hypothetical protein GRI34_03770 [Erythrobacter aquimaris]|uniref:Uncharacterized protein n=1 Tax=Qipengyuania aquimaris TaxID=255984 RepID=A0A6I4THY2_9SPHN|nr:hypothetical protein [Qipengyuania aquimaris]MXO95535.1 hypothetical protein [Qipengyuania aquimaris]